MDAIYATLIGIGGTTAVGFIAWALIRLFVNPLDTLIKEHAHLRRKISELERHVAVLRHLETQIVLRLEYLEDAHNTRHRHLQQIDNPIHPLEGETP